MKYIDRICALGCASLAFYFIAAGFGLTHPTLESLYYPAFVACWLAVYKFMQMSGDWK